MALSNVENFFLARDEIIDIMCDVEDFLVDDYSENDMRSSVLRRLENALGLMDDHRKDLGIPDRNHDSVAPDA